MWIPRRLEQTLLRAAKQRPVVVLTGARQVGKTSLIQRLFPHHAYVALDLPSEAEQAEKDPAAFLRRHSTPLIIDEVQYAPAVFRHLKSIVDTDRKRNGQFILTGSQKFPLMASVSESLAGRVELVELEGLSLAEIIGASLRSTTEAVAVRGGFPELYEKPDLDAPAFYRSYVATYLERDVRSLLKVSSLRDFERFLRACALRSAQLLNKAELARDAGVSPPTASQWLSVLEASNQVALLEPWFSNRNRSLVKTPKLYLCDTGLLCHLLGIRDAQHLISSPFRWPVWETLVYCELRRALLNQGRTGELFFWRDRGREVDFLIHQGGSFQLMEAKWTENPDRSEAASLQAVRSFLPKQSSVVMSVICRCNHPYPLDERAEALPIAELERRACRRPRMERRICE